MYVLVLIEDDSFKEVKFYVYLKIFNSMIFLKEDFMWLWIWLFLVILDKGKIFVCGVLVGGYYVVDMYKIDGKFVCCLGERELKVFLVVVVICGGGVVVVIGG